jgi:hypothetical protein
MNLRQPYDAYWIPGLKDDNVDDEQAVELGFQWLRSVDCAGDRIYVMNATGMLGMRPSARTAARFIFASPQTKTPGSHGRNAVLAIWPVQRTLDLAEGLALNGSLCVIPGTIDDLRSWVARTHAVNLWAAGEPAEPIAELPEEVRSALDHMITFDGHNNFIGTGGKENSIRHLRALVRDGRRPDPVDIENYVLASGRIRSHEGAQHIREWYEGILAGKGFRDYTGRRIWQARRLYHRCRNYGRPKWSHNAA